MGEEEEEGWRKASAPGPPLALPCHLDFPKVPAYVFLVLKHTHTQTVAQTHLPHFEAQVRNACQISPAGNSFPYADVNYCWSLFGPIGRLLEQLVPLIPPQVVVSTVTPTADNKDDHLRFPSWLIFLHQPERGQRAAV